MSPQDTSQLVPKRGCWYTRQETAQITKFSVGTLAVWEAEGKPELPCTKAGRNGRPRYRGQDIIDFLEGRKNGEPRPATWKPRHPPKQAQPRLPAPKGRRGTV